MTSTTRLTFPEFQATGRDVADLRDTLDFFSDRTLYPDAMPGRVYDGDLYLHTNPDAVAPFCVEIANFSRIGALATCEAALYAFYLSECADRDVAAYLRDLAPASDYWPKDADTEASLCALLAAFCAFHRLPHESACDLRHREQVTPAQFRWLNAFIARWDAVMAEQDAQAIAEARQRTPDASTLLHRQATHRYGVAADVQKTNPSAAEYHDEEARKLLALRANLLALLEAAHRADGSERPNRPERAPGYSDAEWTAFLRGWDAHAEAVFASGLRPLLAAFEPAP